MSLGISTASFYPLETEAALRKIAEHGVTCAEIFYNAKSELKNAFTDDVLLLMRHTGLRISALHPMLSFAEPYMLFSEYLRRFEESRDEFQRYFELAATLGAKYVNLHGDRPTGRLPVEEYCERFAMLADDGRRFGVTLCQENVNGYRSADPEFLQDMVRLLGDQVCFTLDVKQCIRAGYTVGQIMEAMQGKIRHVHISDHSPAGDCLLPLNGGFDFPELFARLNAQGFSGDCVIEVYQNAYRDYSEIFESYDRLTAAVKADARCRDV